MFVSGSDKIRPESTGVIFQISSVLQQEKGTSLKIIDHTDDDGDTETNLKLSKERAEAIKMP
ncbi:OmpA family protein [Maribacter antarcticus]|uniref:OmpA family protein n=1 Tax=Maribacter antarcticus TaxID=505250 RepID=UPI000685D2D7|nr:OmpA family protein [Maribacter antarcticus]